MAPPLRFSHNFVQKGPAELPQGLKRLFATRTVMALCYTSIVIPLYTMRRMMSNNTYRMLFCCNAAFSMPLRCPLCFRETRRQSDCTLSSGIYWRSLQQGIYAAYDSYLQKRCASLSLITLAQKRYYFFCEIERYFMLSFSGRFDIMKSSVPGSTLKSR